MVNDYVEQYIAALSDYHTLESLDKSLTVKYDPLLIDVKDLESKLSDAIASHFKVKKIDIKKLMNMEAI